MMDKLWEWLAWRMPRGLVKWCAVRLMSAATVGPYENQVVGDLRCLEALKRWPK